MNENIRMKNEKWDDHSSIVQLFKNLRLCNFLYVFPMEASKGILGRCGTPIYFAEPFFCPLETWPWEVGPSCIKKKSQEPPSCKDGLLGWTFEKNHPKKPYNEKDGFSKTKIEPRIHHLNNTHHTLLFKISGISNNWYICNI